MGVLVVLRPEQDRTAWLADLAATGLAWSEFSHVPRVLHVHDTTPETFPLASHPGTESVERDDNPIRGAADQALALNANLDNASWAIARIIRRAAPWPTWRLQFPWTTFFRCVRDGTGVDIYICDTGVLTTHDEFGGRATSVTEIVSSGGLGDDNGHGTRMMGCAAGATTGTARGALIWSVKTSDSSSGSNDLDLIAGLNAVASHYSGRSGTNRPAVLNLSLVGFTSAINATLAGLIDAGIVVVACAGNTKEDLGVIGQFPAESDADVIVVGGTGPNDAPYYDSHNGSNWGTRIDVSAPAQNLYVPLITSDSAYGVGSNGTSSACAYTTGVVACLLQGHSRLADAADVNAVRTHLMAIATTGKITNPTAWGITLPDRLLYLDPAQTAPETITGL